MSAQCYIRKDEKLKEKKSNLDRSSHNVKWFQFSRFLHFSSSLNLMLTENERFSTNLFRLREPEVSCACSYFISPFQSYLIGYKDGMSNRESLKDILTRPPQLL